MEWGVVGYNEEEAPSCSREHQLEADTLRRCSFDLDLAQGQHVVCRAERHAPERREVVAPQHHAVAARRRAAAQQRPSQLDVGPPGSQRSVGVAGSKSCYPQIWPSGPTRWTNRSSHNPQQHEML